jgi:hypothetical protein
MKRTRHREEIELFLRKITSGVEEPGTT